MNAARYHASRFNEPVSFVSYPFAQAHDPAHFLTTNFPARLDRPVYIYYPVMEWFTFPTSGGKRREFPFVKKNSIIVQFLTLVAIGIKVTRVTSICNETERLSDVVALTMNDQPDLTMLVSVHLH